MKKETIEIKRIDGVKIKELILVSSDRIDKNKEILNRLNVFPVPDGDTGINMSLTLKGAVRALKNTQTDFSQIAETITQATLMEARGCSGTILSQWFKGFSEVCQDKEYLEAKDIAQIFEKGFQRAYRAVEKPVVGTILTVMREASEKAKEVAEEEKNIVKIFEATLEQSQKSLAMTPEFLPVLKEAGVVDSGGQGFVFMLEAMTACLEKKPKAILEVVSEAVSLPKIFKGIGSKRNDLVNKYCFECVISTSDSRLEEIREKLKEYGGSLITAKSPGFLKVHIHTDYPKKVRKFLAAFGEIKQEKVDDMEKMQKKQMALIKKEEPQTEKEIGIVAVTMGKGLTEIFKSIGADVVITGRYAMNPSVRNLEEAARRTKARKIIILPNDKNVLVTAKEVEKINKLRVYVVSSKTIPQGISALLSFNQENGLKQNLQEMNDGLKKIKSGFVTYALEKRNFQQNILKKWDMLGFCEEKLEIAGKNLEKTTFQLIEKMIEKDSRLLSLYYSKMIAKKKAEKLALSIRKKHPDLEVQLYNGGQPHYFYIISCQ